jgi:dolichyl-phosphate beta-glucosyltransferase
MNPASSAPSPTPGLRIVSTPPCSHLSLDLSIIVPAYNEEKRLPKTLERIAKYLGEQSFSYELIIVDDGSRDQTSRVAFDFCACHSWARLLQYVDASGRAVNRGKGFAVRAGMLASVGREVLFSDAVLSTPFEEMEKLLPPIQSGQCEMSIASRALPGSNLTVHQPWYREAMGRTFNFFVRVAIGTDVHDTQCGFKALRGDEARQIFALARIDGFGFDTEMIFLAAKKNLRVREIPVTWHHAEDSRVNPLIAPLQMMRELAQVRLNNLRGLYDTPPKP